VKVQVGLGIVGDHHEVLHILDDCCDGCT
jgi:hypothetical protein